MTTRPRRSPEEAALLNPAFCAALIEMSARDYAAEARRPLPFSLAFLVLPIVLHKSTRDLLPKRKDSSLTVWIENNSSARIGFGERVIALAPVVREAILFGVKNGRLDVDGEGSLGPVSAASGQHGSAFADTTESGQCKLKAAFVGRWFATGGSPATIMALWGISP
jgi:hypothetical protein